MTPKEFHISLDLQLQKINSNAYGNIRPEEKDWLLNESVLRFIKDRINPRSNTKQQGFADTIKRYDDLEDLITTENIPLYKNDDDSLYGILPYNYFHLLKDKTLVANDCQGLTNTTQVGVSTRVCVAQLKDAVNLYSTFKIELDNGSGYSTLIDVSQFPYLASGIPTLDAKFIIINFVLQQWNKIGNGQFFVTWETYDNIYVPNSFIFVSYNLPDLSVRITTDTIDIFPFINENHIKYNYTITNVSLVPNRLVKTDECDDMLQHSFSTTIATSPLSKLESGRLIVYHKKKFIANSLTMDFIRKPRKIDINLNQGCELDESVHDEIVDITVQRIKAILESKNYQAIINENLLTE